MPIIVVNNVQKTFKVPIRREGKFGTLLSLVKPLNQNINAVSDISFSIQKGESVAYLGPNGAGKSTTIKMLTGILEPSSGEIMVNGLVPCKNRRQNSYNIGVVFGQRSQLLFDLPVKDSFELIRYMYSIPDKQYFSNLEKYTSVLEIQQLLNRTVRTLSLGQRMRFEILASLLHDPDILFLDEPTIGLDVVAKDRIRSFIKKVNKDKEVTILLTTHDLSDIERLCQRVIIIDKGRVIYDGSLSYIKERFATLRQIRAVMQDSNSASLLASKFSNEKDLKLSVEERTVLITYDQNKTDTSDLLRLLLAQANPQDLTVKDESIESLIRHIYQYGVDKSEQIQKVPYKG
jgi:ABC-2 type transport system ATP-binding protein